MPLAEPATARNVGQVYFLKIHSQPQKQPGLHNCRQLTFILTAQNTANAVRSYRYLPLQGMPRSAHDYATKRMASSKLPSLNKPGDTAAACPIARLPAAMRPAFLSSCVIHMTCRLFPGGADAVAAVSRQRLHVFKTLNKLNMVGQAARQQSAAKRAQAASYRRG